MKPVLLEIEAFGPYSEPQIIDFSVLKDVNMFLIHGSTGGGKTTILDAICYALYGDTSGNERDAESMRSHFAKDDQLTQVKFTFKIKENTYYIHRIPGQERPKKVGTGFTYQNPEAELYRLEGEEKEFLASGVTKARDKIIEMIGFDSDQFRQVIMIPQGQFRELLVAKSEERQKILGEIFQTRKYKRVEDKIREEERNLKNEVASIKERQKEQIKGIKYEKDTLLEELIHKENIDPLQVMVEVDNLCKVKEEELNEIQKEIKLSEVHIKHLSQQIVTGKNNKEKHQEKYKVEKQYQVLVGQEEVYLAKEKDYQLAQKALPLRPVETYIKDLKEQKEKNEKDILEAIKTVKDLEIKHKELKIQMDQCKAKEPEMKKLEQTLHKAVEEYRPNVLSLAVMEKEEQALVLKTKEIAVKEKDLQQAKEALEKEIKIAEKALEKRQDLNDFLRTQQGEEIKLSNVLMQRKQLDQLEKRREELRKQYTKAKDKCEQSKVLYGEQNNIHNTLLQGWIKGQAAVLAQGLQEDTACPVCGSTRHPDPAKGTDDTVTEEQVNKAKQILDKVNAAYQVADNQRVSIATKGKESNTQIEEQQKLMGDYATVSLETIQEAYNKIVEGKKQTTKALLKLVQIEEKMIKEKQTKQNLEDAEIKFQEETRGYADRLISLQTSIEKIKSEIPVKIQNTEKLNNYISDLEKTLGKATKFYKETQIAMERLLSEKVKAETMKEEKDLQLKEIIKRHVKETNEFNLQMKAVGFKTYEAYKEAYKPQEILDGLNEKIKEYNKQKNTIEAQYKKLQEETKDMVLMDVEKLEQAHIEAEKQRDILARKHQTIKVEKQHNENQKKIILKSTNQIIEKEKRYSIVGSLYRAVRGSNDKGLSFERFIQSSLFEDILIRANERLLLMSNNRYELYRSDNRETKASQAGLDMEVLDTYTGKKRHVRTLSGGEGFMASLSLALGLADVVQSYAGGISLDTIFIDEGFGTLDTESLDGAIKTLIDLQQSGRLVGIISHVPELKERIGARLEVTSTQQGSRAIFHL